MQQYYPSKHKKQSQQKSSWGISDLDPKKPPKKHSNTPPGTDLPEKRHHTS